MKHTRLLVPLLVALTVLMVACQPTPAVETVQVEVEKLVTQQVIVTQVVEVEREPEPTATKEPVTGPVSGGTLIIGRPSDAVTLDAMDSPEVESTLTSDQIFECLLQLKPGTLELEPLLATSWEALDEGTRWRFTLREGVKFHDGTPFNAEAVEFSFMRILDEEHPYHQYGDWRLALSTFDTVQEVVAVDELTVDFILENPFAPFLTAIGSGSRCGIVSPTAVMADPENFFKQPVGTGPFRFVEWRTDERIVLERFEDYWGEAAYLDSVIWQVIPENAARLIALQQNQVHVIYGMDPTVSQVVEASPDLVLFEQSGLLHSYLALNLLNPNLSDARVRQAIHHAINREALVEAFWSGASVARGVMSPTLLGFNDSLEWPEYNPDRARELLEEAGYGEGFTLELITFNAARTHTPEPGKAAEAIQADLGEVGIEVDVLPLEIATLLAKCKAADCDMYLTGFNPLIPDPWTIIFTQFDSRRTELGSANNYSFYRNPDLDALNDQADQATDPAERAEIYRRAQEIIHEDMVRVDIADTNVLYGLRPEVQGFAASPIATMYLKNVWLIPSE